MPGIWYDEFNNLTITELNEKQRTEIIEQTIPNAEPKIGGFFNFVTSSTVRKWTWWFVFEKWWCWWIVAMFAFEISDMMLSSKDV